MQLEYALKNTRVTGAEIADFLNEKTSKLKRYFQGKFHARWNIVFEHDEHEVHLHVTGNNFDYLGKATDHNLYTAIEDAVDKVDRQLSKHKEIIQDHHK